MKKLVIIFVVVLGTFTAKAQESKTSITAGYSTVKLKVKISASEFDESNSESVSGNGFFIGLTREVNINSKYSFKPGILYTQLTPEDSDDDDKLEYLQIPLFFNYYPNEKVFLTAGPKIDYLLEEEDVDGYRKISFALGLGIGFELSEKLDLIANYSIQLSDSLGDEYDNDISNGLGTNVNASLKQNFLNIGLAYNF